MGVKNTSRRSSRRVSAKTATPRVSEKAPTPRVSEKAPTPRVSEKAPEVLPRKSPRVSAKANGDVEADTEVNVNELNDEELLENLKKHGIEVGPIVDSTRDVYRNRLAGALAAADEVDAA